MQSYAEKTLLFYTFFGKKSVCMKTLELLESTSFCFVGDELGLFLFLVQWITTFTIYDL